jgi:hypothetical protein
VVVVADGCSAAVSADGLAVFTAGQAAAGVDQEAAAAGKFARLHRHDPHGRFPSRAARQVGHESPHNLMQSSVVVLVVRVDNLGVDVAAYGFDHLNGVVIAILRPVPTMDVIVDRCIHD